MVAPQIVQWRMVGTGSWQARLQAHKHRAEVKSVVSVTWVDPSWRHIHRHGWVQEDLWKGQQGEGCGKVRGWQREWGESMAGKMQAVRRTNRKKQKDAGYYRQMQEVTSLDSKLGQPGNVTTTTTETVTPGYVGGERGFIRCKDDELTDSRWAGSPGAPHQRGFTSQESHRRIAAPTPQTFRVHSNLLFSIPSFLASPSCRTFTKVLFLLWGVRARNPCFLWGVMWEDTQEQTSWKS